MRNRILTYVYNLFGERETILAGKKAEAPRERAPEGIVLKAGPAVGGAPAPGPSTVPPRPAPGRPGS